MDFYSLQSQLDELKRKTGELKANTDYNLKKIEQDLSWKLQEISNILDDLRLKLGQFRQETEQKNTRRF